MPADHPKGIPLCSLWLNQTKDGRDYYRGRLGDAVIMGWLQEEKKNDKQPDLRLVLYPAPSKHQAHERPATKPESKPADDAGAATGDDIPF